MGRMRDLHDRLERILPLVEDLLLTLTGAGPSARVFEANTAFRWDAARGPGRHASEIGYNIPMTNSISVKSYSSTEIPNNEAARRDKDIKDA